MKARTGNVKIAVDVRIEQNAFSGYRFFSVCPVLVIFIYGYDGLPSRFL